jgi:hypothetical protein
VRRSLLPVRTTRRWSHDSIKSPPTFFLERRKFILAPVRGVQFYSIMNTLDTTAEDKEDSKIQEEPSNIKRKLDQISTEESTAPLNSSENGSTQDVKKARMESLRLPTIFGSKPVNDTVQYVANFLWRYCEQENVEVY